jgi:hypothetical protein
MDLTKLAAIEARASNATPGPWGAFDAWGPGSAENEINALRIGSLSGGLDVLWPDRGTDIHGSRADFEFILHARQDVPRLAKALRLALEGLPCSISPAVKEDPCPCYDCRIRAAALSALDEA